MKIKEFVNGSGLYTVPVSHLPKTAWFIRDPKHSKDDEIGPLLHICERDLDPDARIPTYIIMTEKVRWDMMYGHYICNGCKKTFSTEEELMAVWEDGSGTGDEGQA